jgi:hypothetical protein
VLALLLLGAASAGASARRVPPGFYGVNWDRSITYASDQKIRSRQWHDMATGGVESARTPFEWYIAQPDEHGPFNFTRTDNRVSLALSHGIDLLPVVIAAPPWARQGIDAEAPPRDPKEYCDYLRALIARYGPNGTFWTLHPMLPVRPIRIWQIWNEVSEPYQWTIKKGQDWAPGYGELLRAAYDAIKAADPGAKVVLAGFPNRSWEHLDHLYQKGNIAGHFDIAAVHPFTAHAKGVVKIVKRFEAVLRKHGDAAKPLWATEIALPAGLGGYRAKTSLITTNTGMARFLTAAYSRLIAARKNRSTRVERAYWYTWGSSYTQRRELFDYTGLVAYNRRHGKDTLKTRPAKAAYRRSALAAEGCRKTASAVCR